MVRNYRRKDGPGRRHLNVDLGRLNQAVNEVRAGQLSYSEASRKWAIDRMKIYRSVKKLHQGRIGHPKVLTGQEEELMKKHLLTAADWGVSTRCH